MVQSYDLISFPFPHSFVSDAFHKWTIVFVSYVITSLLNNIDFIFIYRDVLNMFLELNSQIMCRPQYIAAMILLTHFNVISALQVI